MAIFVAQADSGVLEFSKETGQLSPKIIERKEKRNQAKHCAD